MFKLPLFLVAILLTSCVTDTVTPTDNYIKEVEAYSGGDKQYVGAYNNFNYRATILNTSIQQTITDKRADIYLWDATKKQEELAKLQADNGSKTKVFLSFFTPTRMDDNLATKKSVWALYLETSQGRFTGSVTKIRTSLTELAVVFPYHNRFATPYEVEFPVALSSIEGQESTMTITGPLGTKQIKFSGKQ
jgi:hypothetical protein